MAMGRITVPLTTDERGALVKIAESECRDPREQLRYLLREEAQRRGLIEYKTSELTANGRLRCDEHARDDHETALRTVS